MDQGRLTRNYTWEPMAALACFVGAGLSLVIGFVLTTGWVVNAQQRPFVHGVGLTLLIIGLPILILGGHCLDLNDRKAKKANAELHGPETGEQSRFMVLSCCWVQCSCSALLLTG